MIKQDMEADNLDKNNNNNNNNNLDEGEVNPYHKIITNKVEKEDIITSQMEQWLILSNIGNYVQYERHPGNFYDLDIKTADQKSHKKIYSKSKEKERQILDLDFGDTPEKLKGDYLDMYDGIHSEVISTTRFYENSVVSIAY